MFFVETLLNLEIYVLNVHSKNTEAAFPFILYLLSQMLHLYILVILKVPR